MLNITLICLGKLKEKYLNDACTEYKKRLSSYCSLKIIEISPAYLPDNPSPIQIELALERETKLILSKIPNSSKIYCLCIEGEQISSQGLGKEFEKTALNGVNNLFFIIGSSYGLSETVKKVSDFRLSMSKMTFPHQLSRVMLLEQLYRAFQINAGGKYHK
ncbi:MAG TPA: 23S rRNA (pseudouridine(1915)-N(3))-methyltransferase RlmH [Clostridia bacterium]|nr:23S rRNA (pseudouridine(1915)-N(3))-methyltransferase RlmH [Clostridia bacterium]